MPNRWDPTEGNKDTLPLAHAPQQAPAEPYLSCPFAGAAELKHLEART